MGQGWREKAVCTHGKECGRGYSGSYGGNGCACIYDVIVLYKSAVFLYMLCMCVCMGSVMCVIWCEHGNRHRGSMCGVCVYVW